MVRLFLLLFATMLSLGIPACEDDYQAYPASCNGTDIGSSGCCDAITKANTSCAGAAGVGSAMNTLLEAYCNPCIIAFQALSQPTACGSQDNIGKPACCDPLARAKRSCTGRPAQMETVEMMESSYCVGCGADMTQVSLNCRQESNFNKAACCEPLARATKSCTDVSQVVAMSQMQTTACGSYIPSSNTNSGAADAGSNEASSTAAQARSTTPSSNPSSGAAEGASTTSSSNRSSSAADPAETADSASPLAMAIPLVLAAVISAVVIAK